MDHTAGEANLALTYGSTYLVFKRPASLVKEHEATCPLNHPVTAIDAETIARFQRLVSKVKCGDWTVHLRERAGSLQVQIEAEVIDVVDGKPTKNYGPRHSLCPRMDEDFIVDLIFNAIKEVELHEIAEQFYFDGVKIHCPHGPSGEVI
jgi:hypothetical protein